VEGAKLDVVEKILKALSSQEYARIVAENNGFPAVNPGEYDKSKLSPLTVKYNEMLAKYPVTFLANLDPAVLEVLYGGLQEILIGTVTPEDLAERLQEEMDNLG
jgi:raffinose/stachyose/melibiose transport system substrate-binding protein